MNVPTRLLILKRLTALLESIETAPGNTLAGKVYRGRNLLGEESVSIDDLPVLSIMEAPRPDLNIYAGDFEARSEKWTLLITGYAADDKANPSDAAYELHALIEITLAKVNSMKRNGSPEFPEHHLLGDLISDIEIAGPVVRPPDDKLSRKAFFFLPIRVGIVGKVGQPYTSVP